MKDLHPILKYGIIAAIVAFICYLRYIDAIDSSNFITVIIICAVGLLLALVKQRQTLVKQREALTHDKEQVAKTLNADEEKEPEKETHVHVSKTVRMRPTLAGLCCDFFTVVLLIISWTFIIRRNLLIADNKHATFIIALFTIAALIGILQSYLPKACGGMNELLGMKQVKQAVIREHAFALISALIVLSYTLRFIAPSSTMVKVLMVISILAVFVAYFCKYFIKKVSPSREDLEKYLEN